MYCMNCKWHRYINYSKMRSMRPDVRLCLQPGCRSPVSGQPMACSAARYSGPCGIEGRLYEPKPPELVAPEPPRKRMWHFGFKR